jgi:tetratricopeptide (TPR) repeat protein
MRAAVLVLMAVLMALTTGCKRRDERARTRALDEATMAVLYTARALHHQADVFESAGDFESASRAIERVLALRIPAGVEEAEDIRADAWGRLGEIALMAGDLERALAHANTGLRDTKHESVLQARLYVVKGRALRQLAERAEAEGDPTTAQSRRREAIDALETSIQINQRRLGRVLDGGGL